jgi:hypothetical protein
VIQAVDKKVVFLGLVDSLETRHLIVASFSRLSSHESTNLLLATTQFIGLNFSLPLVEEVGSYIRCVVRQTVIDTTSGGLYVNDAGDFGPLVIS